MYRPICRAYKLRIRISCACVRSLPELYAEESLLSGSAPTSHFSAVDGTFHAGLTAIARGCENL